MTRSKPVCLLVAIMLGAILVAQPGAAESQQPARKQAALSRSQDAFPRLKERLESQGATGRFSGGVLVAKGDQVLLRSVYGMANHARSQPLTTSSRFRLASLSKQFTAAAILRLQDRGVLTTSDPVCKWVQPCPKAWEQMRLKHLLAHQSGIVDLMARPDWGKARWTPTTPAQLTQGSAALDLKFQPGTRSAYNNTGFNLAGVVVENAARMPFHSFLKREFFAPLGMSDTGYENGEVPHLAMGYANLAEGLTPQPRSNASVVFAAGGLYSTLDDMFRWQRALHGGKVLSAASYAEMIADHDGKGTAIPSDGIPRRWGYGLFTAQLGLHVQPAFAAPQIFHTGSWAGFRNLVSYQPEADITVVVLSNNFHQQDAVFLIVQQAMAEALGLPFVQTYTPKKKN